MSETIEEPSTAHDGDAAPRGPHPAPAATPAEMAVDAPDEAGGHEFGPRRFWVHATALAVVLLATYALVAAHRDGIAFPDEGVYNAQAELLSEGAWRGERPTDRIDPDGRFEALGSSVVLEHHYIPYPRRPLYPLLLAPWFLAAGAAGTVLVSTVGTWLAALCSGRIASRIDTRYAVPTLWLVGLASPLLYSGLIVAGHSLAAALAAAMVWSALAALERRSATWLIVPAATAAALVLLRSEGTLLVGAAGAVFLAGAVSVRAPRSLDRRRAALGLALWAAGAAATVLDSRLAGLMTGEGGIGTGSVVSTRDPASAAWVSLLRPWYNQPGTAAALVTLAALSVWMAAVAVRVAPRRPLLPIALLVLAAGSAATRAVMAPDLITGLVPAFVLLAALVQLTGDDLRRRPVGELASMSALTAVALVFTLYEDGGSAEWGGRFFHVLVPLLVPLCVLGLDRARRALDPLPRRVGAVALAVVLCSWSVLAVRENVESRTKSARIVEATADMVARAADAGPPLVVVHTAAPSGVGRAFWRDINDGAHVIQASSFENFFFFVHRADDEGYDDLVVTTNLGAAPTVLLLGTPLESVGWHLADVEPVDGTDYVTVRASRGRGPQDASD